MNGRRIYHARGKVLGGSSSINGQIFQRGNPLDYERWAADPGHGDVGLRPLPAVLQEDGDLPRGRARRPVARPRRAAGPGTRTGHEPAVPGLLRGLPGGRLPPDRRRQRLPPGGLRAVRSQHPRRPAAVGLAGVPEAGPSPEEPHRPDADVRDRGRVRGPARRRRRHRAAGWRDGADRRRRDHPRRRRDQHARSCSSCRASGAPRTSRPSASRSSPTCRVSAPTSRTTSRSTSSTSRSSRSRCSRRRRSCGAGRSSARSGCSCAAGRARPTTSRAAGSPAPTRTSPTRT